MRVDIDARQLEALKQVRKLRSPGGAAQVLGISRQRVNQQLDKKGPGRGYLGWQVPAGKRFYRSQHYVYVDLGSWDDILGFDPTDWWERDLDELIREGMREYAEYLRLQAADVARMASGE